jgi:hypothetical protein
MCCTVGAIKMFKKERGKLPEYGNIISKHVGATIYPK